MAEMTLALIIFLFPLAYSPGPGNMFFAANGARFGVKATLPSNAGYHIATFFVTAAIGLGFAAAMTRMPQLFTVLKLAGAAYVLFLAWKLMKAGVMDTDGEARPASFMDGAALLVLNPKAYVIISLMFSQFLTVGSGTSLASVLWIALVFTVNNLAAFMAWTIAGDRIATLFRDQAGSRRLNLVFGTALAAVAVWMMLK